jgi:hypothetical protein
MAAHTFLYLQLEAFAIARPFCGSAVRYRRRFITPAVIEEKTVMKKSPLNREMQSSASATDPVFTPLAESPGLSRRGFLRQTVAAATGAVAAGAVTAAAGAKVAMEEGMSHAAMAMPVTI